MNDMILRNPKGTLQFDPLRLRIHIYPIKGLTEDMLGDTTHSALIACSSRVSRLAKALFADNFCAVHFLDTIDQDVEGAIKREHADTIKDFLFNLSEEITDLYISCDGGDSRSPAIAAAVMRLIGRDERRVWRNPYYTPNILVYFVLCESFGVPVMWDDALEQRQINEESYRLAQNLNGDTEFERWEVL